MKNLTNQILGTVILLTVISFALNGQTNVSGGIYTNTTWSLVNSPYIVVDTVVVFPGVTLTIQPGVVVKFESNKRLEIRQAKLIAWGTSTDSITFTSNSSSPIPGIWSEIYLNAGAGTDTLRFNYCNFKYANIALNSNSNYSLIIKNSDFSYNKTGLASEGISSSALIDTCNFKNNVDYGIGGLTDFIINKCNFSNNGVGFAKKAFSSAYANITNSDFYFNQTGIGELGLCLVDNCTLKFNQYGIIVGGFAGSLVSIKNCTIDSNYKVGLTINDGDTIFNNKIRYNPIGLTDSMNVYYYDNVISKNTIENNGIGIKFFYSLNQLYCNKICNSTTYDLYYNVAFGSNLNAGNNYWCTSDSITTTAKIYDGYDNINLGLVNIIPLDTLQCYLGTGILTNLFRTVSFSIFPNPVSDYLIVALPINILMADIKIFNMLGEIEYSSISTSQKTKIDVSTLTSGIHIFQIATGDNIARQKFVKQ
jgi:hypothetical protein